MQELAAAAAASRQLAAGAAQEPLALDVQPREARIEHSASAGREAKAGETLSMDERQRRAAERWLAYREELAAGKHSPPRAAKTKDHDHGADLEM